MNISVACSAIGLEDVQEEVTNNIGVVLKISINISANHHQIYYDIQGDLDGTEQTVSISDLVEEKVYQLRVRSDGDGKNSSYSDPIEVMVPKSGMSICSFISFN